MNGTFLSNEILLLINTLILYSGVLIWYRLFNKIGLLCWTVFATVAANIEVLILVDAFAIEQTLGNIMFATTFLVTDILSETEGKKAAQQAVSIGIGTAITMIIVSQIWLLYTPSSNDWASESIHTIFANTPRLVIVSLCVYAIAQRFDVWLYHKIWALSTKITGDPEKWLWLRNNASTLTSQLINTVLYNLGAFWGIYEAKTMIHIIISGYLIFVISSLADTPCIYIARKIHKKHFLNSNNQ